MKEKLKKFFSDKFNMVLSVIQCVAVICLILIGVSIIFNIIFLLLESVFFVLWGIKILMDVKKIEYRKEIYSKMPYTPEQLDYLKKKDISDKKNGKFRGVTLILLGLVLIYMTFCAII